ncbi:MAG: folylpolyglutamate synthase/dihydrofolate synthase family protein [Myxococcota bacterium]|nr:folylpolyglutamate synthase/dihydrofolate synthase family protein [Myxococcota bacterium]
MKEYAELLTHLYNRPRGKNKLGLELTKQLLKGLNHPEKKFPAILVAGTNGKGSTTTFLSHCLQRAELKVGVYTSPHLLRYTERIRINDKHIDISALLQIYQKIQMIEKNLDSEASFFEATTVLAFTYFAQESVDIAVLEVGLGGRLDCTNVCNRILTLLTPIGLDHQHILGESLGEITQEKLGIIRSKIPLIPSQQSPQVQAIIEDVTHSQNVPVISNWKELQELRNALWTSPSPPTDIHLPPYQEDNLATALTAFRCLQQTTTLDLGSAKLEPLELIRSWSWPGRYQFIDGTPPIIIDGAHNPAALKALHQAIDLDPILKDRPAHYVFSALRTKDFQSMLENIGKRSSSMHLCPLPMEHGLEIKELKSSFPNQRTYPNFKAAFDNAKQKATQNHGFVVITGSLFLVAETLSELTQAPRDPLVAS